MDNYEEYILRVLRRTNAGLQDSLIPAHAGKLSRLVEKFESTQSLQNEIEKLKLVIGFSKSAVAMEWLFQRAKRPEEDFSPEQFESDILLMNEKLFEAFLNQPFDMPDYNVKEHDDVPVRPIQKDVQISDDEFLLMGSIPDTVEEKKDETAPEYTMEIEEIQEENKDWNPIISDADIFETNENQLLHEISPALSEIVPPELLESITSIAQTAFDFSVKSPGERPVAMAVMRVSVKTAIELGKSTNNVVVQDFLETLLSLINYADTKGKIKSESFAGIMLDIGDRLNNAIKETSNGADVMNNLTQFINDPKELFSKR